MRHITPDMPPEVAQRIYYFGDLKARWMLFDLAYVAFYDRHKDAAATLIHAHEYLKDRAAYELEPWPKNRLKATEFGGPLRG